MVTFEMPGQVALAYVMMYVCLPLYTKRKYIQVAIVFSVAFLVSAFSAHAFIYYLGDYYTPDVKLYSVSKLLVRGFYLFANAAIATIIKLTKMWYEIQNKTLESELKMLKDR